MAKKIIFKTSNKNQQSLFPYSFDSFVDQNHPARIIDKFVDMLDISIILQTYKGGGASSYDPRMMIKVILFGYLNNLYSSRRIAKALKENVHFMWLSGQQYPDFHTINNFRGKRLKDTIEVIFKQLVIYLQSLGIVTLEEVFTDGTKIEAVSNRYTFVWKKSVERHKKNLENKINVVLEEINKAIDQDNKQIEKDQPGIPVDLTSSELRKKIDEINQAIAVKGVQKTIHTKVKNLQKDSLPKLKEYEDKLKILGERNSYSKTDLGATFMRMKDDHMKNGQLKPAYNIQLSTENNFITNYTTHQNPGDTVTFREHLNSFNNKYEKYPQRSIADAGYGGLENYDFLEENNIENYVKFNYFHKEQTRKFKSDISKVENLYYNEEQDYFICPMGQGMYPVKEGKRKTSTGYEYKTTTYQALNCSSCPLRGACHKQKGNRQIEINKKLVIHKQKVREI